MAGPVTWTSLEAFIKRFAPKLEPTPEDEALIQAVKRLAELSVGVNLESAPTDYAALFELDGGYGQGEFDEPLLDVELKAMEYSLLSLAKGNEFPDIPCPTVLPRESHWYVVYTIAKLRAAAADPNFSLQMESRMRVLVLEPHDHTSPEDVVKRGAFAEVLVGLVDFALEEKSLSRYAVWGALWGFYLWMLVTPFEAHLQVSAGRPGLRLNLLGPTNGCQFPPETGSEGVHRDAPPPELGAIVEARVTMHRDAHQRDKPAEAEPDTA